MALNINNAQNVKIGIQVPLNIFIKIRIIKQKDYIPNVKYVLQQDHQKVLIIEEKIIQNISKTIMQSIMKNKQKDFINIDQIPLKNIENIKRITRRKIENIFRNTVRINEIIINILFLYQNGIIVKSILKTNVHIVEYQQKNIGIYIRVNLYYLISVKIMLIIMVLEI